jgi:predicted nucleotidyltransferase
MLNGTFYGWVFLIALPLFLSPSVLIRMDLWQRILAAKDGKTAKRVSIISGLGMLKKVYLVGDFAKGKNSNIIDLLLVGDINKEYLTRLIEKVEKMISRKVRYLIFGEDEIEDFLSKKSATEYLLLWEA